MGSAVTVARNQPALPFPAASTEDSRADHPEIRIAGRALRPTAVFDTYWRFAAKRQAVYLSRLAGEAGPWTDDPILLRHRFTNCYRAADRVSQYLIRHVSYEGSQQLEEVVFRTLLFKLFNRVSTWELLRDAFGEVSWENFDHSAYDEVLSRAFASGHKLYSAAYVVPPPRLEADRKHSNHLRLLELMMTSDLGDRIADGGSLRTAFELLQSFPAMGNFLGYQFAIDLNYSAVFDFDEMEFVVPGPGARDGIRKCFGPASDGIEADIISYMADHQQEQFERLGLAFAGLFGRPLQLVDCQNLFCEVDKYARVAHPEIAGHSGRSRIKQLFEPVREPVGAWFPPKWGLRT
ncbi:nucleotide kinase domain-containing protein [Amycolatopsis sp. NBC_01480]|uniref:nucleotide kinase domain-containing protein n=1 Tax=Amycolatopsis sp. NBC_01480 TaxID=2903562 RepID=UPI002E2A57E4|nr:nucleotide kinase domain-containing protein [Amycolatopsis sp. NBC_01480]